MKSMNSINYRLLPIALILSLLVLGLTACGSDDDPTEITADTIPPTMVSIDPPLRSMRVPLDVEVTVTFSEAMDTTITTEGAGFAHQETERVWWESPTELHMTPVGLPEGRQIILSIRTEMKDLAGNHMVEHQGIPVFTESEAFMVLISYPPNGYDDISRDTSPMIHFSQPPNMASLAAGISVGLVGKSADLSYTLTALTEYDIQMDFTTELPPNQQVNVTIDGDVLCVDGQTLPAMWQLFFTTGESGDSTAPLVNSVDPANSQPNVALDQTVTVVFSEPMTPTGAMNLSSGTAANPRWEDIRTFKFELGGVDQSTEITASLDSSFTDVAGNGLADFSWSFTTISDDFSVSDFAPTNGSDGVSTDVMPVFTFSQRVQTMDLGFHLIINEGGVAMESGLYSLVQLDYNNIGINFDGSLNADTVYDFLIDDTMDNYENELIDQDYSFTFMTGTTGDTSGPELVSVFPPNGSIVSPDLQSIVFEFSEPINSSTFEPTSFNANAMFWITDMEETNNNQTMTLYLTGGLPAGLTLDMILGDITDMAGNPMDTDLEYGFTVAGTPDFFPVNSSWTYYQTQTMGEDDLSILTTYEYLTHPHFVRYFWADVKTKEQSPTNQWYYTEADGFVKFEGYGEDLNSPILPPVRWMGISELATAWHDTVTSFSDTGAGYLDGALAGIEDVQYMGEGAPEGIYWGDCRHYRKDWYSVTDEETFLVYIWEVWYAPGIGPVKEAVEMFDSSGESDGVFYIHTLAIDNGMVGPLKSAQDTNWWQARREMGRHHNEGSHGSMKGFPFFTER